VTIVHSTNRARSSALTKWRWRLLSLLLFALAWEALARALHSLLMPRFGDTLLALGNLLTTPALWNALWVSNQAMVLGFTLAVVFGVPLGFLMGRQRTVEKFLDLYLNILLVTPMSALIPIIILATGITLLSRVLVVFSFAFVVIVVNTRAGLRTIDASWVEMARTFGASERQLWQKIFLRGALPALVTGLRLGLTRAVSGMVTVELLLIALGVGRLILDFQGGFDSANLYATILVVVLEAVLLMQAARWLERRVMRWMGPAVVR
jgi:ABC-type nitrate/sulfonate/bicarbonate transport system permease component